MPNSSDTRPDALTELVHILREQLRQKDERIAALEALLAEATRRSSEQQRLLAELLTSNARTRVLSPAALEQQDGHDDEVREGAGTAVVSAAPPKPAPAARVSAAAPAPAAPVAARTEAPAVDTASRVEGPRIPFKVGGQIPSLGAKASQLASLVFAAAEQREEAESPAGHAEADAPATVAAPEPAPAAPVAQKAQKAAGPDDEFITTARFDRDELRRGHRKLRAAAGERRWPRLPGFRSRDGGA